ncbi:MAG: hypothetical protein M0000_08870 [Actinomycetota bacterium]|nr:hypothetical protein [Actinomycetota bacterium]
MQPQPTRAMVRAAGLAGGVAPAAGHRGGLTHPSVGKVLERADGLELAFELAPAMEDG